MDFSARCNEDLGASLRLLEAHNVGSVSHRPGIGGALSPTKQDTGVDRRSDFDIRNRE